MSKTYVYMNKHIRKPRPKRPVIAVHRDGETRNGNTFVFRCNGKVIGGVKYRRSGPSMKNVTTHAPRAWVWFTEDVQVVRGRKR